MAPRTPHLRARQPAAITLVVGLLYGPAAAAQQPPRAAIPQPPAPVAAAVAQEPGCDLALVLSGGGARGIAHIGVLEALLEAGVWPDCIAGASMGSVVGALFAAGHPPQEIWSMLSRITWRDLYSEPGNRTGRPILHRIEQQRTAVRLGLEHGTVRLPHSLLDDALINRILIEHLAPAGFVAGRRFDRLPIAFRAVGTDLNTGDRVVLSQGDLARAVRGSMSVPLAYPPVRWGNALLIDGGLVDNIPVSLAKDMGARYVIAVDVSTPVEKDAVADLAGVTRRIIDLLFTAKNTQYGVPADLTIRPEIGQHSFANYSGLDALIEEGRTAGATAIAQIPERYRNRPAREIPDVHAEAFTGRRVSGVVVEGNEYLDEAVILREFDLQAGSAFDLDEALAHLDRLAGSGLLTGAWLDFQRDGEDGVRVVLRVREEYRHTADIGLAYLTEHQAQGLLRLETRNLLGGGDRLQLRGFASARDTVLGVRLLGDRAFGTRLGYQLDVENHREKPKVFRDTELVNRAEFRRRHAQLLANLPFSLDGMLQLGLRVGRVEVRERLGVDFAPDTFQHRVLVGRYVRDTLSSLALPRSGLRLSVLAEDNAESLGGTASYFRLRSEARAAVPAGPLTAEIRALYGYASGDLPVYDWFRIGGPELIPGLAREEIWGRQALAGSASLGFDPSSISRVYARVGAGNVWDRTREVTLSDLLVGFGLGVQVLTPIGPIQADYGWSEEGRSRFYFAFGWQ